MDLAEKRFVSRDELYEAGLSAYKINQMVSKGKLEAINRNCFENTEYSGEASEFCSVTAYAPKGVICLTSAAIYHGLSTSRPLQIDVALPRRSRIPNSPERPQMKYYLFNGERYSIGIETIVEGNDHFRIYDAEKTVCDMMFYRNKLGFEPAIEVLRKYVDRPDRDFNKLMEYAEKLRCANLLRTYLEVMV